MSGFSRTFVVCARLDPWFHPLLSTAAAASRLRPTIPSARTNLAQRSVDSIKARLSSMAGETVDIPIIIGGKEIRTGDTGPS